MTKQELKDFMQRIKSHYQEFIIDDYKMNEWYKELKDYDYFDVNTKLEEHLKSQDYGSYIPKVHFLTKYLTKSNDKSKIKIHKVQCPNCHAEVLIDDFDNHYDRCSSVDYAIAKTKQYLNKTLNRESLMNMPQIEFVEKYEKLLKYILQNTKDEKERKRIQNIFNPPSCFSLGDIM